MTEERSQRGQAPLDAVQLLRDQVDEVHTRLEAIFGDWLRELGPSSPPQGSQPVAIFIHAATVEDIAVQTLLRDSAPLFATDWAGRGPAQYSTTNLAPVREYARDVFARTNAYLTALSPIGANREVDLSRLEHGRPTVGWVVGRFVVLELAQLSGELVAAVQVSKAAGT
jgi:hypothetical protein